MVVGVAKLATKVARNKGRRICLFDLLCVAAVEVCSGMVCEMV